MPFDPDAFLKQTAPTASNTFDPDGFLKATAPTPPSDFDPDAFLKQTDPDWLAQRANELKRGMHSAAQMVDSMTIRAMADEQRKQEAIVGAPNADLDPAERWLVSKLKPGGLEARAKEVGTQAQERASQAAKAKLTAAEGFSANQQAMETLPTSAAMRDFQQAEGFKGKLKSVLHNPIAAPTDITLQSAPSMVPGIVASTALGSEFGPVGTAVGAFVGSLTPEYQGKIIDVMADSGVDLKDPQAVAAFMSDHQRVGHAQELALRKGLPIALVDTFSALIGGRFLRAAQGRGAARVAAATATEGATQAAAGAAGETAGEFASGEQLDPGSIIAEAVAEVPGSVHEVATNVSHERRTAPMHGDGPAETEAQRQARVNTAALRQAIAKSDAENTLPATGDGSKEAGPSGAMVPAEEGTPVAGTPPKQDIDAVLGEMQATEQRKREAAAAETAERVRRQQETEARRHALLGHIDRAAALAEDPAASFAAVQGALASLEQYEGDNSLTLPQEQRERLETVGLQLARRREALRGAEEARRAQEQADAKTAAEAEDAQRAAAAKAEQARLRQIERTGRDENGQIVSLSRLPLEELQRIDELQDYDAEGLTATQVETELRRRMQAEERTAAQRDESGNDLLSVLRQVKLPDRDAALGAELNQLIGEGMTVAERKRFVNYHRSGGLDSVAEQLREDHGFTQIETPADVIDHVQRALRGEQVLPARRIEFATPNKPGQASEPMASGDGAAQQSPRASSPSGQGAKPFFPESNRITALNPAGAMLQRIREENPGVDLRAPKITAYRATIGTELRLNDYVALNRSVAENHLESLRDRGEGYARVHAFEVSPDDLLMANDATEFVYFPRRPESLRAEEGARDADFARQGPSQPSTADRYRTEVRKSLTQGAPWTGAPLELGIAAEPLRLAGLPAAPIRMDRAILTKAMADKHPFSVNKFLELPERLQNPIAVFSSTTPGDYVVLTEIREAGHNFVVPLDVTADRAGITINRIKSVYPKDGTATRSGERVILDWIQNGQTRYFHRQKLQSWMSTLRSGLSLPTAPTTSLLQNVPSDASVSQVQFAQSRPAQARLSEARKNAIWRRLQTMLPELTRQVEIKIALTRRAYREALNAAVGPGQGRGTEAVAIPANFRQDMEAAEAERNAIIFAADAWTSDRKGVKRLLHEVAHVFYWTLPPETQTALKAEYARQLAAAKALQAHFSGERVMDAEALARAQREVGVIWDQSGQLNSDLDGLEDGDDHGLREWFAELTMWRNRQWALRRYVQAGTFSGRLRMMIDDAADALREMTRQVARAFVQARGQDFAAEFWDRSFRDFLANGAKWGARQESAAVGYAKAEFARPDFATPQEGTGLPEKPVRSFTPEQAAADGIGPDADPQVAIRRRIENLTKQRERMASEGGSIAAYNHISEEIRDLQEQRRRAERSAEDTEPSPFNAAAPTEEELRAPRKELRPSVLQHEGRESTLEVAEESSEESPFNEAEPSEEELAAAAERAHELRSARVQALEGRSAIAPSWHTRTWDKVLEILRGFKGSIPELPTFPRMFWNRADPFLKGNPVFYNDVKQGFRSIQRMDGIVRREAEDRIAEIVRPLMAAARDAGKLHDPAQYLRLLELQARASHKQNRGETVPAALRQEIAALQSRIDNDTYVMFSRLVMYLDLRWRAQNLKTDQGQPIALPMGLTLPDVEARLAEIRERIAASGQGEAIAKALKAHTELVAKVADDLETRELFPQETLRNPYYFPHLVLNQTSHDPHTGRVIQRERNLALARVEVDTGEAFRGYLLDPVGSERPIETDYVKAMFYHLVQVGAHNAMADARDHWFKPYDIRSEVAERAKQLSRQRGQSVSWRQAFEEEFKERGYVLMTADLGRNLMPAVTIDRQRLAERLGAAIGEGDLQAELAKLDVKGIRILPEDVRECLMAGEKEYWVVPARVAEALQGIKRRAEAQDNAIEKTMGAAIGMWKKWMLYAPHNWIRYEFNNRVADLEKLFSADPMAFRYLPQAFREVRAYYDGRDQAKITPEVRAAARHGVVGGITAEEIGKLPELNQLEDLATDRQRLFAWLKAHNNTAFSRLDESAFRYAKFLADLERIRAGARPVYAGAYHADIDHILNGRSPEVQAVQREIDALRSTIEERNQRSKNETGAAREEMVAANARAGTRLAEAERRLATLPDSRPELAAAEISNKTFGDYGDITVNGAWLRKKLAPFWSWTEVNFKYHANLFRNLRDAVAAGDTSAAAAAKAGTRAAAVFAFTLTRKGAALYLVRLALPYISAALWNSGDDDRRKMEEELSEEDRRRFHIIVGRTDDGKPEVVYLPTAFSDIAKWFGGPDAARLTMEWLRGQTTLDTALGDWTQRLVPDAINNLVGQIGPAAKIPYVLASHRNPFPDVLDQRTIPAYDFRRAIIAQATDQFTASLIERALNSDFVDPRTMGDWASQLILQVRRRDPESWAFYAIKDKAEKFVQDRTGRLRDPGAYDAPEAQVLRQFRRAIYQADMQTAVRMYDRLLAYGYTADRFKASIRSQHPLANIPTTMRDDFLRSLTPYERAMLDRAMRYYTRMGSMRDDASRLFPKQGKTPRQSEVFQRLFTPQPERLRDEIENRDQLSEEEIERESQRLLRSSLR